MSLIISGSARLTGSLIVRYQSTPPAFVAVRGQSGAPYNNAASAPIAAQPWSMTTLPSSGGWLDNGLVYGNGVYMVVSFNGLCFITSDGVTWTQGGNLPALSNAIWSSVAHGNGVFLSTSFHTSGGQSNVAARSTDNGQTWSSVTLSRGFSSTTYGAYGNGTFLVMPSLSNTATASFLLAYSTDGGQTWTNTTAFYNAYVQVRSTSPVYVNNRFVMLYSITNVFTSRFIVGYLTSTDGGVTWVNTDPGIPEQPYQTTGPLITNGANFVINPSTGFYSTNGGTNWSQAANRFADMTYNPTANIFVALASDGNVFYSDSANIAANTWTSAGNITGSASTYWNNIAAYNPNI